MAEKIFNRKEVTICQHESGNEKNFNGYNTSAIYGVNIYIDVKHGKE